LVQNEMLAKAFMAKNANLSSEFCKPTLLQACLLRWFDYVQNLDSNYVCYLTSMFICLIRSSMFIFVNLN